MAWPSAASPITAPGHERGRGRGERGSQGKGMGGSASPIMAPGHERCRGRRGRGQQGERGEHQSHHSLWGES